MSKRKVLIVDDDADVSRVTKLMLEHTGPYDVRVENNPKLALRVALDFHPDVILLDVIMPERDGGTVAAELRQDEQLKNTPIVFLTAIVGKHEVASHKGLIGNVEVLAKPATIQNLIATIEKSCSSPR
jgi:CheY-like chemotaxis protein